MACNFLKTKRTKRIFLIITLVVVFLTVSLTASTCIKKYRFENRVQLAPLAPKNTLVSEEQLDKDIEKILSLYGLKKSTSDVIVDASHPNYKYLLGTDRKGKGLCLDVIPIFFDFGRTYTEVETYMEIWLYIMEHEFDYEIDGMVYYFTSNELKSTFAALRPNELYMTKEDFLSLYNNLDIDDLSHPKKVKKLAEAYVEMNNYQRRPGHVQVR